MKLSSIQSIQDGAEASGLARPAAVPSPVPGALGSVWEQTAGDAQEPGAACASLPGPQRQPDGGCYHSGVSNQYRRAQDGGQSLYHSEDIIIISLVLRGSFHYHIVLSSPLYLGKKHAIISKTQWVVSSVSCLTA